MSEWENVKSGFDQILSDLQELKVSSESSNVNEDMELEQQMINLFVRLEVQRRYFNICGFEMLSKCFGMQEPSALEALTNKKTEISVDRLLT